VCIYIRIRPRMRRVYNYLFNINWLPCSREIEPDKMDRSQILNTFDVAKRIGERAPTRYTIIIRYNIIVYTYKRVHIIHIYGCSGRRWRRQCTRDDADLVSPACIIICEYVCVCIPTWYIICRNIRHNIEIIYWMLCITAPRIYLVQIMLYTYEFIQTPP